MDPISGTLLPPKSNNSVVQKFRIEPVTQVDISIYKAFDLFCYVSDNYLASNANMIRLPLEFVSRLRIQ
jgi:hypothetical protein